MPKPHYLSPLFSTPAVVAGSGVSILTTLYPQTANSYDPQHPGLNCVSPTDSTLNIYSASDVTAMGAYLVGQGIGRIVFDWETLDTPGNRAVVLQILTGLRATGLRVDLYGVDPTNTDLADWKVANSQDDIHVISYPYRNDPALWLSNTGPFVAAAAARYGRTITLWIAPKSTEFPPSPPALVVPPPWGTYSEAALRTALGFARDTPAVSAVVVWWSPSAAGPTAPWDSSDAAWAVIREYAGSDMGLAVPTTLSNRLWSILSTGESFPAVVKPGNWLNRSDPAYWVRERSRKAPNDFPAVDIEVGVSGSHSGFAKDETFAVERTDFLDLADVDWDIERIEEVLVTVRHRDKLIDGIDPVREAIIDDFMRAGPRLGIPETVYRLGIAGRGTVYTHRQRGLRDNEIPAGGTLTEIRFSIVCLESGRASLVA